MKKIHKNAAEKQAAYLQRKREKEEIAVERADLDAQYKALNLCGFAETAYDTPAQSCQEEIQVHRSWLRALEQPDIKEGETLRALARRTWNALLSSEGLGVVTDGGGKWIEGKWVEKSGQRRRRFYKLTALGRKALPAQRRSWRELIRMMERIALSGG